MRVVDVVLCVSFQFSTLLFVRRYKIELRFKKPKVRIVKINRRGRWVSDVCAKTIPIIYIGALDGRAKDTSKKVMLSEC